MLADVMAQSMLAACRIAYREWLTDPRRSLIELGEEALGAIEQGLVKADQATHRRLTSPAVVKRAAHAGQR